MIIREGGEIDIDKVVELWVRLVNETEPSKSPVASMWRAIAINSMRNRVYKLFVMEDKGIVVGFLDLFILPEPSDGKYHCIGRHMYILPSFRNTIYSGLLYRTAIKRAKEYGADIIDIMSSTSSINRWTSKGYKVSTIMVTKGE